MRITTTMRLLLLLFLCLPGTLFGQYKQLLHKSYKEKAQGLNVLYENVAQKRDSLQIQSYADRMKAFALCHHDKALAAEADLLRAYVFSYLNDKTGKRPYREQSFKAFRGIAKNAEKENLIYIQE